MEKIDDIPIDNSRNLSPEEADIINTYFGAVETNEEKIANFTTGENGEFSPKLRLIGNAIIVMVVLNNPIVDKILDGFPALENILSKIVLKILIMAVALYFM